MTKKLIIASGTLAFFILLAINPAIFAVADSTTKQTISVSMNGFAFTNDGCCPDVSTSLNGEMIINEDGTRELSQQGGNITLGSTTLRLEFIPSDKTSSEVVSNDCSLSHIYQQSGEIRMVGNNGTIIKGSGTYSWGTYPSCSNDNRSFTNFSGKIQDSAGQSIDFYTGTDSLPTIQ